jgi:hypothetical protein
MSDSVTLHQKIEGRRGEKQKAKEIAVFLDFAKVTIFFGAKTYFTLWKKLGLSSLFQNRIRKLAPERNSFTFIVLNGICIMELQKEIHSHLLY